MSKKLLYKYTSIEALFEKLQRDRNRVRKAIQNEDETDLCDHFFNFCVTAHALRDWVIKSKSSLRSANAVHDACNSYQVLQMCRDIANANKHFKLGKDQEKNKKTYSVFIFSTPVFDIYEDMNDGSISPIKRENLDIGIMGDDGVIYGTWEFADKVVEAWEDFFKKYGVKISQS